MKKLLIMLAAVGMVFTACEGNGGIEEENGGGTPFIPEINYSPKIIEFKSIGGEKEVTITANFEYEVSTTADWIDIEILKTGIKVVAEENAKTSERNTSIVISNKKYDITKVVEVKQVAYIPKIELSQKSIEVDIEPNTYTVSVTSPYSWEAKSDNDWIIVKSKTGIAGTETLSFSIERNVEEEIRKGTITVMNSTYNLATEFYVTQKACFSKITLDKKELNFTVEGGEQSVKITANVEYEVSTTADWITYTKTENGITVSVPKYEEVKERTAEITISNEKYGISKTVKVAQCAFEPKLDVTPTDINFTAKGGSQDIAVTANFEYEVSTIADWVTYTKTENGITVSVPKYEEVKERTVEITISNEKYGVSKNVTVSQAGLSEEEYAKRIIFYTTSDNKVIILSETDAFGANIVSNTYENGKGIITFDAPVTSIGSYAFYRYSSLTSVTIPDSVTSIGELAFSGCTGELIINSKIIETDYTYNNYPANSNDGWLYGSNFTKLTIGNNITKIGSYAFEDCSSLTSVTIPDSVTSIGRAAFSGCSSLTSVTIGKSVTSIGEWAFGFCSSLSAFYGKYASADKRCLIIDGVLNSFAPAGLTSYTIPDSVTSIGEMAFYCSSLRSVTIPDSVTSIGEYAFFDCRSLTSITIPDSVTSIGASAFEYCLYLTSVTIGNSVTEIGSYAFSDCSSLRWVYCKPTTPPTGASRMFRYNDSDCKIYVPRASVEAYKSAQYWSNYASYIVGYDF